MDLFPIHTQKPRDCPRAVWMMRSLALLISAILLLSGLLALSEGENKRLNEGGMASRGGDAATDSGRDATESYPGPGVGHRLYYYQFRTEELEVQPSQIILHDVKVEDLSGIYTGKMTLVVDEDTLFDESCDLEFFDNYRENDTPLTWFRHNIELMNSDPDQYMSPYLPLLGVFEVSVTGTHIDRYYGCYWWD